MPSLVDFPLARPFDFPQGSHGLLLIHGLTGTPAHMRLIGEEMHRQGFAVRGILLPGHGETPESMLRYGWQDWLLCAREAARDMAAKYAYFSAAGLSMGGVLSLLLAQEMPLTACVTIAAPMKTVNRFRYLAPIAAPIVPMVPKRIDPVKATLNREYDLGYEVTPARSTVHLTALMRRARQHLPLVTCPILAVQSHADRIVTADSPDIILRGVSSRIKEQLWLENAPHVCTISPEWGKIAGAMARFLRESEKIPGGKME